MKTNRFAKDVLAVAVGGKVEWKPNGGVWLSLHTEDPTADGNQDTNEVEYPGYQRLFVESSAWDSKSVMNVPTELRWPKSAKDMVGEQTVKFIGLGLKGSGSGYLARITQLDQPIVIKSHTIPAIEAGGYRLFEA